jgi:outer membrane receptor protein involved in Fe transport
MKMNKKIIIISCLAATMILSADSVKLNEIVISSEKEDIGKSGRVKDVVIETEVMDKKEIEKSMSTSFSDAVANAVGVQTATGCSLCGLKRIKINGLRGDHTTVLFDDIPMYSTVASYYGMDAISMSGIDSIEITRGSGAALIAPEAIAGVVNIKSQQITDNAFEGRIESVNGEIGTSILGSLISQDKKLKASINLSKSKLSNVDEDKNGVSESPMIENESGRLKTSYDISDADNLSFVYNRLKSKATGGIVNNYSYGITGNSDPLFEDDDIRKKYIGEAVGITEIIKTTRDEVIGKWKHELSTDGDNMILTISHAKQKQNSLYESDTYDNIDNTLFADMRFNKILNDENILTVGIDYKNEKMRSESSFYANPDINKDDFNSQRIGLYLQDSYMPNENTDIAVALRIDKVDTDWLDIGTSKEIDKTILSPRVQIKHNHNKELISRLALGTGYHVPLTFFESEHGILDGGFGIDISDIEKSKNINYSLSYDNDRLTSTVSLGLTHLKNLAYIDDTMAVPTLKTSKETMLNKNFDITAGYQLTPEISIGTSYEHYFYDSAYKLVSDLASIEDRAKISLDYEHDGWAANLTANWFGSRNLSEYGYEGWNTLADVGDTSKQKMTKAPSYYTVDARISKDINKHFSLYAGVKNLFDYTQTNDGESPLFYGADGGFDTAYIYAPLRGREIIAGLKVIF